MLRIQDVQRRAALGELVRKNILGWIEDNSTKAARDAFLTVAFLEGPASLSWLKAIVGDSQDAEILEASAHAACTVVTQSGQNEISARFVEGTDARGFFETVALRLEKNDFNEGSSNSSEAARARLIEALGAFGGWVQHGKAAGAIARWFCDGTPVERAAAVRAASHLIKRQGKDTGAFLLSAMNKNGFDVAARFVTLALMSRR